MCKISALQDVITAIDAGKPIPPTLSAWLSEGLKYYVDHPGTTMDESLLLKPEQGRQSVWDKHWLSTRNNAIYALADTLRSSNHRAATRIDIMF